MQKEIKITVTAPVDCTDTEFLEWITAQLRDEYLHRDNPLWLCALNPDEIIILES